MWSRSADEHHLTHVDLLIKSGDTVAVVGAKIEPLGRSQLLKGGQGGWIRGRALAGCA